MDGMTFVKWKKGEDRRGRVFEPVAGRRPDISAESCPECGLSIGDVKPYRPVAVGPTSDEAREKYEADRWFTCGAVLMHESCSDDMTDADLDAMAATFVVITTEADPGPR